MQLLPAGESSLPGFSGPENRFLVPPEQTHIFRDYLLQGKQPADPAFLASHALDSEAMQNLKRREHQEFLLKRRQLLLDIEARYVEALGLTYSRKQGPLALIQA